MTAKVEVTIFPKKCPHCGTVLTLREYVGYPRNGGYFLQCRDDKCPAFAPHPNTIGQYRYEYGRKTTWKK